MAPKGSNSRNINSKSLKELHVSQDNTARVRPERDEKYSSRSPVDLGGIKSSFYSCQLLREHSPIKEESQEVDLPRGI